MAAHLKLVRSLSGLCVATGVLHLCAQSAPGASAVTISEFALPTAGSEPFGIAPGPDGNLWFTELSGNRIGRITAAGAITEFPLPIPTSEPLGITAGPDGNIWFAENTRRLGRITP